MGTSSGLFILDDENKKLREITFDSKKVIAIGLKETVLGLLVATQKYRLLRKSENGLEGCTSKCSFFSKSVYLYSKLL
jgi:hypothetical protein